LFKVAEIARNTVYKKENFRVVQPYIMTKQLNADYHKMIGEQVLEVITDQEVQKSIT
jgi:hypothetical protein